MNTFGSIDITWSDYLGYEHVLVATRGASWQFLCRALPSEYETVDLRPQPTEIPVVWKHDRKKVTCTRCVAALDGDAVIVVGVRP